MLTLCLSSTSGESAQKILEKAKCQIAAFEADGCIKTIQEQFDERGRLIKRGRGKPLNVENERAVLALKADGLSQLEIAEKLGLALSSVREYWKRETKSIVLTHLVWSVPRPVPQLSIFRADGLKGMTLF
ncbi:hypothetical protein D3C85_1458590 [compost metagenome]